MGVCGYGTRVLTPPLHSDPPPFPRSSHQPCACFHPWAFADPFLRAAVWGEKKPNHYGAGTSPPKDPLKKQFCKENLAAPLKWLLGAAPLQTHPPPPPKKNTSGISAARDLGWGWCQAAGPHPPNPQQFPWGSERSWLRFLGSWGLSDAKAVGGWDGVAPLCPKRMISAGCQARGALPRAGEPKDPTKTSMAST